MDMNLKLIVLIFLLNAFSFTLGLSYNQLIQSVISHYSPPDKTIHTMRYNMIHTFILTLIFVWVIYFIGKFFPDIPEHVISKIK
jgi:uncharacterized BrkB/YihY/UPF0761 family membrane protein